MPYCSRCGVEVDGYVTECPLCKAPIQRFEDTELGEPRYPADELGAKPQMGEKMRRRTLWEVLTLLYAIAVIVVIGSDLRVDAAVGWSLYATASIVLAWVCTTLVVFYRRRPVILSGGVVIATIVFLAAIDLVNGRFDWFFGLGLPILAVLVLISGILALAIARTKRRGFNIVAFILLGVAAFSVAVDLLVSFFLEGKVHFTWSVVVLLTLVPLSLIFLFLHYRLGNRFDLRRIFHF